MIIFAAETYFERFVGPMLKEAEGVARGMLQTMRYPDGELCVAARQSVDGQDCLLVGTIAPPDSQLLDFLLQAEALKRAGASRVVAFLPYLAYARQDKFMPGQGGGIAAVGALLRAAGVDRVITIDLHSELDKQLLGLPVTSLMPAPQLFVREIQRLGWLDVTVVSPDEGGIGRNQALAEALGVPGSVVHLAKSHDSIVQLGVVGDISPRVMIADDILDSGRTLVSACNVLHQHGVKQIAIAVTHGLFTGEIWKELFGIGIDKLFVTDTCPQALKTEVTEVKIVSIRPLLGSVLAVALGKEVPYESAVA